MPQSSTAPRRRASGRVAEAQSLARHLLGHDPRRLRHVAGTARAAGFVATHVPDVHEDVVVAAAWLHDIGHAGHLVRSGFHPLDGALYLQEAGWDNAVVGLVAYHSHCRVVADHMGLTDDLTQFENPVGLNADTLTFADVIAGSDGQGVSASKGLAKMLHAPSGGTDLPEAVREERYRLLTTSVLAVHAALAEHGALGRVGIGPA